MASPLSPAQDNTLNSLNLSTPASHRYDDYEVEKYTAASEHGTLDSDSDDADTSSPFMSQVIKDDQENNPPPKLRPASRVLSGAELSPLKLLQLQDRPKSTRSSLGSSDEITATATFNMPPPATVPRSPRKMSAPEKRFPVKISATAEPTPKQEHKRISLEEVVRENQGLRHAIDIFEDDASISNDFQRHDYDDEAGGPDDTMVSTFSTFSAVPNLTMFANLRPDSTASASKFFGTTPRPGGPSHLRDLSPSRTPRAANGPLPNRTAAYESGNTTSLMDFTENLRLGAYQPSQPQPTSPSRRSSKHPAAVAATPQRPSNNFNLLDFDIPPLPTPRSIPTITPRELESLKSGFLSEISSLKASLSGKEAEAQSLKTAVGDAEKRVGECMEQLREAKSSAEELAAERESWEKRGREMEAVLRKVKEEIVLGRRDREELEARLDESEKRRDMAETMAQEAESKMAGMRAGKASAEAAAASGGTPVRSPKGADSNKEVEIAVERVARELHALYKSKHETKVAALRKSYEHRWEKRIRELQAQIDELSRENEELRVGRDATMTRVDPAALSRVREEMEEERKMGRETRAQLEAEVEKLEAVVRTVKADNEEIRGLLEKERVEKGELVQLAEEMMNMQSFVAESREKESREREEVSRTPATVKRMSATPSKMRVPPSPSPAENGYRGSIGGGIARPSGLRAPGAGASRIGKVGAHGRTGSTVSTGVPRPGSGMGMRSGGLLSSIEKMGSYRGRAE
ncbi:hypothetical protein CONLIGDRAFT_697796 [Coniochaeta ligniaria NRRL 30616]|uniref:Kinetoplast-associated protein KAP n=1 Tax=Coniochaeta ligniaria NRRL 30616 TaxID=1408157 RepID=A0A1J7IWB8_9PEZI|nr:hypothetical protein CONLIGDRAFT_697796 [Coniochaeta ligniaria NRRL 30616]